MARKGYVKPRKVLERLQRRIAGYERIIQSMSGNQTKGFTKPGSQQGGNGRTVRVEEEKS